MKNRIAIIAMAISALVVIGCAGTPATVNRYGDIQPSPYVFQPQGFNGTDTEYEARTFGPLVKIDSTSYMSGFNRQQIWQMPFGLQDNPDGSITVHTFKWFQITLIPMTNGSENWGM